MPDSYEKIVQDRLATLISAAGLTSAGRSLVVEKVLPERFTQRALPKLVVREPEIESQTDSGAHKTRTIFEVELVLIDGIGVRASSAADGRERLRRLSQDVVSAMRADNHLGMADLYVFTSDCRFVQSPVMDAPKIGNNLLAAGILITIPTTLPK